LTPMHNRRMSPFGYIQPFFTRHGIKKMITRDYIDKDKCALDFSSVTEKRRHGYYPYKPDRLSSGTPLLTCCSIHHGMTCKTEDISRTRMSKQLQVQPELQALLEDILQSVQKHEARSRCNGHLIKKLLPGHGNTSNANPA
jgi:hypothetical protein